MLSEDSAIGQRISTSHCRSKYGHYGVFATYPLCTAVLNSYTYDFGLFEYKLNPPTDPKFAEYIDSLVYEDKNYFTVDEICFLLRLVAPCQPLSNEQIDSDLRAITADVQRGRNMLKSHAQILSKAISYWKMHFDDKYARWLQEYSDASDFWYARKESGEPGCQVFYCRECDCDLGM